MTLDAATGTWVFADEYGNTNIATEKEGVSQYFIVAAVVVRSADLSVLRAGVEGVRAEFFPNGELKSKTLGKDRPRWLKILNAISGLPFRFYGLAVDKRQIDRGSGLQWKKSFYKNLCGRAYRKLMRAFPDLHVRADQHGRTEFMESFVRYVRENHRRTSNGQGNLFDQGTFEFVDSKDEVLVQLADLIAGLLARSFDPEKVLPKPEELLALVRSRALLVDEWPVKYRLASGTGELPSEDARDDDARIATYAIQTAEEYLGRHDEDEDFEVRARVVVLERLLFERRLGDAQAIPTANLVDHLQERGFKDANETWVRRNVIAPLRDAKVLLTSSSSGYKLPGSRADVVAFASHAEAVCIPMLNRTQAACDAVKLASMGDVDVLGDMENLRRLTAALDAQPVAPGIDPVEP